MFEPVDPHPAQHATRVVQLFAVGILGLIGVGFVVGLRQGTPTPDLAGPLIVVDVASAASIPATTYGDFDRRRLGINREWSSPLANIAQPATGIGTFDAPLSSDGERRQSFLEARLQRRAFDGAPPVVPHPIDQMSAASCIACHRASRYIGKGVWTPPMSHPYYANCTQCHAEMHSTESVPWIEAGNTFHGRANPGLGSRAWDGAPPTIPHTTWMRENCLSCHGPRGANPIRTSHPWRVSCTQCHAPSAELDQVFTDGLHLQQ